MNKKKLTPFIILLLSLCSIRLSAENDNLLLITIDTLRCDRLSIYSTKYVQTPNIDKIAKQGTMFLKAFAHTPLTLPSHTNILTGATPLYHGISDNIGFKLAEKFLTLGEHLKKYNYSTGGFVGSMMLSKEFGLNQGFDVYIEPKERDTFIAEEVIANAFKWIRKRKNKWFCWIHLWDPHVPYSPPAPYNTKYEKDLYSGEAAYTDAALGRLFSLMEKNKLSDNTYIVITADHGEALGEHGEPEHGFFAYNSTIHIPLIFYGKNVPKERIHYSVSHIDIFPTICDFLNIPKPKYIQGNSLLPLMNGKTGEMKMIYFESKFPYHTRGLAPLEGVIFSDRKYIHLPIPELYDLNVDFNETRNIISKVRLSILNNKLNALKQKLSGKDTGLAVKKMDRALLQQIRTIGYLQSVKQSKKSEFTREDDLKVGIYFEKMLNTAMKLLDNKKFEKAISLFRKIIEKRSNFIGAYIHLSDAYMSIGKTQLAEDILRQGLKIKPGNMELKARLGARLTELNKVDMGIKLLKEVLEKEDFNQVNWNHLGNAYIAQGKLRLAFNAYKKAIDLDNKFDLALTNMGVLYFTFYSNTKKIEYCDNALEYFNRAIKANPKFEMPYNGRAVVYMVKEEFNNAIKDLKKALGLNPANIDVYFNLAGALIRTGNKNEALKYLNRLKENFYNRLSLKEQNNLDGLIMDLKSKN